VTLESPGMSPCPSSGSSLVHRNGGSLTFKQVLEAKNGALYVSLPQRGSRSPQPSFCGSRKIVVYKPRGSPIRRCTCGKFEGATFGREGAA
jgi:hypothetical protein